MEQKNNSGSNPANTKFQPHQFIGTFTASGGKYFENSNGLLIKLCERKQSTQVKPIHYVVTRSDSGTFAFLSSLYPTNQQNTFTAEIQRQYFTVVLEQDKITVSPKNSKG
jgi:hypothetical protein